MPEGLTRISRNVHGYQAVVVEYYCVYFRKILLVNGKRVNKLFYIRLDELRPPPQRTTLSIITPHQPDPLMKTPHTNTHSSCWHHTPHRSPTHTHYNSTLPNNQQAKRTAQEPEGFFRLHCSSRHHVAATDFFSPDSGYRRCYQNF